MIRILENSKDRHAIDALAESRRHLVPGRQHSRRVVRQTSEHGDGVPPFGQLFRDIARLWNGLRGVVLRNYQDAHGSAFVVTETGVA